MIDSIQEIPGRNLHLITVFSVGGYHPLDEVFCYSALQCFTSRQAAEYWRKEMHKANKVSWMYMEIVEERPLNAVPLAAGLKSGTFVFWNTLSGEIFAGWIDEYDNGTAIVVVDQKKMAVRCD